MAIPGFTADASLARSGRSDGAHVPGAPLGGRLVPQLDASAADHCKDICYLCLAGGGGISGAGACAQCDACLIQVPLS
jgi:hypothetical protein